METNIDYTIGDDIVCVQTHSKRIVKEGDLKVCLGLRVTECCGETLVDIGIKSWIARDNPNATAYLCPNCNGTYSIDNIWWLSPILFKKLDTLCNIDELTEILEKEAFN